MKSLTKGLLAAGLAAAAFTGTLLAQGPPEDVGPELNRFSHRTNPSGDLVTQGGTASLSPITPHGGPVMGGTVNLYLIWYGNWSQTNGSDNAAGQALVSNFLSKLNASPDGQGYMAINVTYGGGITGNVVVAGSITDTGSQGTRLTDAKVATVVSSAITSGKFPNDPNGIYFVLTSSNVSESSGFCSKYCGWHTKQTVGTTAIKYSFVGNANRCLSGCAAQTISPNGNAGVDGMISVIAHELEEAITDPNLNAWYDASGAENADKCAWTFGQAAAQKVATNGSFYNMTVNGTNYLVQRNLSASDNKCYVNINTLQQ